jgi:hypothetical protein
VVVKAIGHQNYHAEHYRSTRGLGQSKRWRALFLFTARSLPVSRIDAKMRPEFWNRRDAEAGAKAVGVHGMAELFQGWRPKIWP